MKNFIYFYFFWIKLNQSLNKKIIRYNYKNFLLYKKNALYFHPCLLFYFEIKRGEIYNKQKRGLCPDFGTKCRNSGDCRKELKEGCENGYCKVNNFFSSLSNIYKIIFLLNNFLYLI